MSNTATNDDLKCINCEYQDLKPCVSCVPCYPVDMMLESEIRKQDLKKYYRTSEQKKNRDISKSYEQE